MWFTTLVLKSLLNRKVRSSLTSAGIAIAVCGVVTIVGMSQGFETAVAGTYSTRGVDIIVSRAGAPETFTGQLDEALDQRLLAFRGVSRVEPVLVDVVTFEQSNLPMVYLHALRPDGVMMSDELRLLAGRKLHAADRRKVLIGQVLARSLAKEVGDKLEVEGAACEVVGIFEGANMFEAGTIIMNLRDLQQVLGIPERVTAFLIRVEQDPRAKPGTGDLCQRITGLTDATGRSLGLVALSVRDHVRSHIEMKLIRGMAWATSFIALLIGTVGVLNTMMISVSERTREIGMLRAIGWRKLRIVRAILLESFVLSCTGVPLGLLLSVVLTNVLSRLEVTTIFVPRVVEPAVMVQGSLVALVSGLAGSLYPALRAASLLPTHALRYE